MNREILFRGQHRRKGEKVRLDGTPVESKWVYGGVCQYNGKSAIIYQTEPEISKFPVYADTLGQYTGLTDKNGVKIFEGDILDLTHYMITDVGVVRFGEYKDLDMGNDYPCGHVGFYVDIEERHHKRIFVRKDILFFIPECKVIGNVFDNAELLKGENNG